MFLWDHGDDAGAAREPGSHACRSGAVAVCRSSAGASAGPL